MSSPAAQGLAIRVTPGAKNNAIEISEEGTIKVRLRARAVDGKANNALREYLSEYFNVPLRAVNIRIGEHSRNKVITVDGFSSDDLRGRLQTVGWTNITNPGL